ncbi:MAG: glycerol-3-phosphate 1-O-acyltransferase PlsY [Oscillospiraceae bacterium]|nr:glycerol-3-phosphate 1-O-acyltransferase PlsY [Oscillospiraceae bacterium]
MKFLLAVFASALPAYLLGGVNGAIITSMVFYRKDIRKYGSGNPGLTNFYRVFGKGGAILVVAIDVAKSIAPVMFGGWVFSRYFDMKLFGQAITGFFVIMGHCFPVFYNFKGGKGIMAAGAILFIIDWRIAVVSWGTFILIAALTRYVSLGSIIGTALFPPALLVFGIGGLYEFIALLMCALLLIARHQANIRRLIKGEESKFNFRRKE